MCLSFKLLDLLVRGGGCSAALSQEPFQTIPLLKMLIFTLIFQGRAKMCSFENYVSQAIFQPCQKSQLIYQGRLHVGMMLWGEGSKVCGVRRTLHPGPWNVDSVFQVVASHKVLLRSSGI